MWWIEVRSITDLCRLVKFEKEVQPEKDWMTVEDYVTWYDLGLRTTVLKDNYTGNWKGSYQLIDNGEGDMLFAGFGRHPEYEAEGIGQILMNRMISKTKGRALICETRHDNHRMIRLIKANGFVFTQDEYKDDDHWTWWKRDHNTWWRRPENV